MGSLAIGAEEPRRLFMGGADTVRAYLGNELMWQRPTEYLWTGAAHNSPSEARTGAEVIGRNEVPNPSFENGLTGWGGARLTIAHDTTRSRTGLGSAKLTPQTDAFNYFLTGYLPKPANHVVLRAYVYAEQDTTARLWLYAYAADGTGTGESVIAPYVAVPAGKWTELVFEVTTLTSATAQVRPAIGIALGTATNPGTVWVDGYTMAAKAFAGEGYFDGDTPDVGVVAPTVVPASIAGKSSANVAYGTTAKTCPAPSNLAAGDMVLAVASCDWGAATAFTAPTGFTVLAKHDRGQDLPKMLFAYKTAGSSEPTSYTFGVPVDADARFDMFAIRNFEAGVVPTIATQTTASSATTHQAPAVTPPSGDSLVLSAASLSASAASSTFAWTPPAGMIEQTDQATNGYQTQTTATESRATADAVAARAFTLSTTSAAMPAITASLAVASLNSTAGSGTTYPGATLGRNSSGGSGGPWSDRLNVTFAPTIEGVVRSSYFHIYAAHLDGSIPRGILFHLHGDGAYEPKNPTTWTNPLYRDHAKRHGFIYVCPKTPDTVGSETWWENAYSHQWLKALFDQLKADYPIDLNRVWWSGFSGGAQATSYNMVADYHGSYTGGGAFMLGGGSMEGGSFTGTPTSTFKTQFPMRWVVGELDDGSDVADGFNARAAAENGRAYYAGQGFTTSLVYIPNESHNASEDDGPPQLGAFLDSVYGPK